MTALILIALILAPALLPPSATAVAAAEPVTSGVVSRVVDGDTLVLENGSQVRLVGIQAPKLPLGRRNLPTWPLAHEVKAALAALTLKKPLVLTYTGRRIDRHGRLLAHLSDADGRWIQGVLLARGMARVYTFPDNRARGGNVVAGTASAGGAARDLGPPLLSGADPGQDRTVHQYVSTGGRARPGGGIGARARLSEFRARLEDRFHRDRRTA